MDSESKAGVLYDFVKSKLHDDFLCLLRHNESFNVTVLMLAHKLREPRLDQIASIIDGGHASIRCASRGSHPTGRS
jgi:hypothetical protein